MEIINNFFIQTPKMFIYIGALIGHMLSLYDGNFAGTQKFLSRIFDKKSDKFYARLDLLLLPLIGYVMAAYLIHPVTAQECLFSGLSWSGSLIALLNRNTNDIQRH